MTSQKAEQDYSAVTVEIPSTQNMKWAVMSTISGQISLKKCLLVVKYQFKQAKCKRFVECFKGQTNIAHFNMRESKYLEMMIDYATKSKLYL